MRLHNLNLKSIVTTCPIVRNSANRNSNFSDDQSPIFFVAKSLRSPKNKSPLQTVWPDVYIIFKYLAILNNENLTKSIKYLPK